MTFSDATDHDGYYAPAELEPLRRFVNTADIHDGIERLTSPDVLVDWLRAHDLIEPAEGPVHATQDDLEHAIELREALRALLVVNQDGGRPDPAAVEVLNAASDRAALSVRFTADGWSVCACGVPGVAGAFGRLLAIVADAQNDGTWTRLKVCAADDCSWAYYDVSRNRSRRWCSMDSCGNRAKVAAYRGRATQATGGDTP